MELTGENRRTRGKTCPSATLSTTNPTWTDLGSNPGPHGVWPAAIGPSVALVNEHEIRVRRIVIRGPSGSVIFFQIT
jgi:hypothetical protein